MTRCLQNPRPTCPFGQRSEVSSQNQSCTPNAPGEALSTWHMPSQQESPAENVTDLLSLLYHIRIFGELSRMQLSPSTNKFFPLILSKYSHSFLFFFGLYSLRLKLVAFTRKIYDFQATTHQNKRVSREKCPSYSISPHPVLSGAGAHLPRKPALMNLTHFPNFYSSFLPQIPL